jgi:hypothetical protein
VTDTLTRQRETRSATNFQRCGDTCTYDQTKSRTSGGGSAVCDSCRRSRTKCDRRVPSCTRCTRINSAQLERERKFRGTGIGKAEFGPQATEDTLSTVNKVGDSNSYPYSVREKEEEAERGGDWEGEEEMSGIQLPVRENQKSQMLLTVPQATTQEQNQLEEEPLNLEADQYRINWGDTEDLESRIPI